MRARGRANTVPGMYIHPEFRAAFARQRQRDVITAADRNYMLESAHRRGSEARLEGAERRRWLDAGREITIRPAVPEDARALANLAILDDASPLEGELLLAEVEGDVWAASSLLDGRTIADPFRATVATRALLGLRREQIAAAERCHAGYERQRRRSLRQLLLGS